MKKKWLMKWENAKDRVAKHIIESAEKVGELKPEMIILNK
jgi:cysteine synthase